jgi:hypothetical protein
MLDTEDIVSRIEAVYKHLGAGNVVVPLALQAVELTSFARDYMAGALIIEREAPQHWLPVLQNTGHAVELALKACLASAGTPPQSGHDLIELYRHAEALGFGLDAPAFAAIVHVRHFYFEDLATGTRYKARYPTRLDEPLGGAVPDVPCVRVPGGGVPGRPGGGSRLIKGPYVACSVMEDTA